MDSPDNHDLAFDEFKPGGRFHAAFGSLCILVFATALDATTLAPAIPVMSHELGGSAIEAFWAGTSFLLAATVFQLTFGSMSQTFGRKHLILIAIVFFLVGSILTAMAADFPVLLLGRTIQGAGGGGITSLVEILITDLVPLRHRGTWFGFQSAITAVGAAVGPVVGGGFADSIGWRWIFWINVPLCGVGFVAVVAFLKLYKVPGSILSKLARFDWAGVFLLTASATAFLVAISWGGIMFPWSSWQSVVPLTLGLTGMGAFAAYEGTIPADPAVRLSIFSQRTALVNYLGTVIHGLVTWCLMYYLPLYYQCILDYSPTMSGVAMLPELLSATPAAILVGVLVSRWCHFRWAIWSGWCLTVLGMGLLCLLRPDTAVWEWVLINIVPGLGVGMLYNSLAYGTQTAAEEKDVAYAASMYVFSRTLGQSIGVATGGAILQSQLEANLQAYPALADRATALSKEASALVDFVKGLEHGSPERIMIIEAYADSLRVIWAVMTGLGFVGLMASGLTRSLNVNRTPETKQGLRAKTEKGQTVGA